MCETEEVQTGFWWGDLTELVRHRSRWEDNIKRGLHEVGCGSMGWIDLVQDKGQMAGAFR